MPRRPLVLVPFAVAAPLLAQVAPAEFDRIQKEGIDRSQVMQHLDHLTNRIGPRLTSSDNLTDACEWARDTFASFGLEARLEQWGEFAVGFNRGPWWGRVTSPEPMELVCNTDAWSAGTRMPSKGALLVAPKNQDELAQLHGKLAQVWLLDPPGDMMEALSAALTAEGGYGFVGGSRNDLLITAGRPTQDFAKLPTIPFVRVRKDQHDKLAAMLADGKQVEVEFDIRNHFKKGPIPLYNVIADLVGSEHPDEYVVVGGHIDSWDGATGTTDNGTGTATTLEAARILTAIGAKPKRTIRFMLWSGEEQGLLGSRAWVQAHKDDMARYSAALVHDGGTNYVSGIAGMKEMRPQLQVAFEHVLATGGGLQFMIRDIDAFRPIGSDHESFTAVGVPGFFWDQAGSANYTHTHHTQYDTYDAAIPDYQMRTSIVVATGALGIANLPELLSRENMKVERGFGGGAGGGRRGGGGRMLGVQMKEDGVTLDAITDGGAAAKAGLKAGDKLLKIGDTAIANRRDLFTALQGAGGGKKSFTVLRDGQEVVLEVVLPQGQ